MSRVAFLTGTVGGIMGTIASFVGIIWAIIWNTFKRDIEIYAYQLSGYINYLFYDPSMMFYRPPFPYPPLIYPSGSSFYIFSSLLVVFLIMTGVLLSVGFYGTYKIGGGGMSLVGLIFSLIGMSLGALFIVLGNLIVEYTPSVVPVSDFFIILISLPIPNSNIFGIGFLTMALTFIILGVTSISVRYIIESPSVSLAAGIISIVGAVFFIIGFFWYVLQIIGFGLVFIVFILWAAVFYSSRNL